MTTAPKAPEPSEANRKLALQITNLPDRDSSLGTACELIAAHVAERVAAETARLNAEIENLVWNLAGCSTYAMGAGLDTEHNAEMARPALNDVRKLALDAAQLKADLAAAQARLGEAEKQCDALTERSMGAMQIAEGDEGHEAIPRDCPMLQAVSDLRKNADDMKRSLPTMAMIDAESKLDDTEKLIAAKDEVLVKASRCVLSHSHLPTPTAVECSEAVALTPADLRDRVLVPRETLEKVREALGSTLSYVDSVAICPEARRNANTARAALALLTPLLDEGKK